MIINQILSSDINYYDMTHISPLPMDFNPYLQVIVALIPFKTLL